MCKPRTLEAFTFDWPTDNDEAIGKMCMCVRLQKMWQGASPAQWCTWPRQISFEPGFAAYQSLAQKMKVSFSRFFSFFLQF